MSDVPSSLGDRLLYICKIHQSEKNEVPSLTPKEKNKVIDPQTVILLGLWSTVTTSNEAGHLEFGTWVLKNPSIFDW